MNKPLQIDYYSDVLCIWAWIAQLRLDELYQQWGEQIQVHHHFVDVFGDVPRKIATAWQDRDGYRGYAKHVQHAAAGFQEVDVHTDIWSKVQPASSANAHMIIKAVALAYNHDKAHSIELGLRKAFFLNATDIGDLNLLFDLLKTEGLDYQAISKYVHNGSAMAALMGDYQTAKAQNIKGSPTYVMDGGRQVLFGNVGYRVIHANIEELLNNPKGEASWC